MISHGNLYQQICTMENLVLADKKARRGKKEQYGVKVFDRNPEVNLMRLQEALVNKTYTTPPYKTFVIKDPKEREIFVLPYPDRIVQHAIMNILEPIFVSTFTRDTYSCIKGRGIHACSFGIRKALKDTPNAQYYLKIDVKKFYPSVDHEILKALLRRKIKDKDLLWLLDNIIDSAPGVPIGNYLSQYFGNFYLSYLDHFIKEQLKAKHYFRYCDDMLFLAPDKPTLHQWLYEVRCYLHTLKLEIKPNYRIAPVWTGIDMAGYKHYPDYTRLRKSIKQYMARAIYRGKIKSIPPYMGWAKHCDSGNLLNKLLKVA